MRPCGFAELGRVFKSLVRKAAKIIGQSDAVGEDVSQHRATACLRPYRLNLKIPILLTHVKQRMYHADLLAYTLPVEEMLVFLGGEMKQNAVVGLHTVYEYVGEGVAPETVDGNVFG